MSNRSDDDIAMGVDEHEELFPVIGAPDEPGTPDPFGAHEFAYEPGTDLFRCCHCRKYEVTVRGDAGGIIPCEGDVPGEPMVLNAY